MKARIAGIINDSITDGPGLRLSVFAQGCKHNCPGCHNPDTHDILGGKLMDTTQILDIARANPLLKGITLTGGEPFLQIDAMTELAIGARTLGLDVIIYTGFNWEEILADPNMLALAKHADFIIDGKFIQQKKTLDIPFVGSSNQRIIDIKKAVGQCPHDLIHL